MQMIWWQKKNSELKTDNNEWKQNSYEEGRGGGGSFWQEGHRLCAHKYSTFTKVRKMTTTTAVTHPPALVSPSMAESFLFTHQ